MMIKNLFYAEMFNCATGKWPLKYLGVPVSGNKLHVADWRKLDEKLMKRLDERKYFIYTGQTHINKLLPQ